MKTPEQITTAVMEGVGVWPKGFVEKVREAATLAFAECEKNHENLLLVKVFDKGKSKNSVLQLSQNSIDELKELKMKIDPEGLIESMNIRADIWDSWAYEIRELAKEEGRRELAEDILDLIDGDYGPEINLVREALLRETAKAEKSEKHEGDLVKGQLPAADISDKCETCGGLLQKGDVSQ